MFRPSIRLSKIIHVFINSRTILVSFLSFRPTVTNPYTPANPTFMYICISLDYYSMAADYYIGLPMQTYILTSDSAHDLMRTSDAVRQCEVLQIIVELTPTYGTSHRFERTVDFDHGR
jgi:hypothetical protein